MFYTEQSTTTNATHIVSDARSDWDSLCEKRATKRTAAENKRIDRLIKKALRRMRRKGSYIITKADLKRLCAGCTPALATVSGEDKDGTLRERMNSDPYYYGMLEKFWEVATEAKLKLSHRWTYDANKQSWKANSIIVQFKR